MTRWNRALTAHRSINVTGYPLRIASSFARRFRMKSHSFRSSPATRLVHGCVLSLALVGAGSAFAQQAPAGLEKAVTTAGKWVTQADSNQADSMWKASNAAMQKNVTQANWSKYIGEIRQQAGAEQERVWVGVSKVDNPANMPAGEYLNVVYATKFAKVKTIETVSMTKKGSSWEPIGYIVRPEQSPAAVPSQAKPTAQAQQPVAGK
jgi:hypothetical protein